MEGKGYDDRFILHWYVLREFYRDFTAFLTGQN